MKIRQELDIIIEKHPHHESLNKKLLLECEKCPQNNSHYTNIKGTKLFVEDSPTCTVVANWVESILKNKLQGSNSEPIEYDKSMWFAKYDKGDYTEVHSHEPYALFSWVYFVNCPSGSSPLVLTDTSIEAEEGKIVIAPAFVKHSVPKNNCKDRITLVGNMLPVKRNLMISNFLHGK